ncbi:hypothetical protein [Leifsonia aquatica]|uniref:hypothetical protein n=1 Tax=Leifsonia aquatica TaxID=144185 RepID=UPI0004689680|nr:hypothetical protein [Leifsonia aquatica]
MTNRIDDTATAEYTVTVPTTVSRATLEEILDGLGFDWYWAYEVTHHDDLTDVERTEGLAFKVGYWDDGEQWQPSNAPRDGAIFTHKYGIVEYHEVKVTWQQLADGLALIASGKLANVELTKAASTYLHAPNEADGDFWLADVVVQAAAFGKLVFG